MELKFFSKKVCYLQQGFALFINVLKKSLEPTMIDALFFCGEAVPNFFQSSLLTNVQ